MKNKAVGVIVIFVAIVAAVAGLTVKDRPFTKYEVATCDSPVDRIVPSDWHSWGTTSNVTAKPPIPIPSFSRGGRAQIENIKRGLLFVDRRGPMQQLADVRWGDESHGRYYSTQLHGLVGIGAAFDAGTPLPDEVANAIGDHIRNWAHCAVRHRTINSRAWYEGTVIKRQANLLKALAYIRGGRPLGDLSEHELLYLLDIHATYLLDTPDIYVFGNHGIRQDLLLATTALHLPDHPRSREMLKLAERRLESAAVELFTEEGIWKEHAPGYVYYGLRLIDEVKRLSDVSHEFNPRLFLSRYDSSMAYLQAVRLPDGRIPYIGSSAASRVFSDESRFHPKPKSLTSFPGYGHAVVRGDHPDGLYLLFVAAQNLPAGKRHADDLSFIVYNFGRPWIIEGGHGSYEPTAMNRHLRSPLAHNTYVLGGKYIGEHARPELDARLLEATQQGDRIVLKGQTKRFPKIASFERGINIDAFQRVTVTDALSGAGAWEGRLHFPGDFVVTIEEQRVLVKALDGRTMEIVFDSDRPLSLRTCKGEMKPTCGWTHAFGREAEPATTLMWSFENSANVTLHIRWSH